MVNRNLVIMKIIVVSKRVFGMLCCLLLCSTQAFAQNRQPEQPNILWITSEDNAAHWLGCYGNEQSMTPRIDQLAAQSTLFENAFANAPVCAVARSTILTGCYAPTLGTQHMRSRYPIPATVKPYVRYLRDQGYFCTNRAKTDFNIEGNDKEIWDECSGKAHYKNRGEGQPFFAIFNITVSHESSLFPNRVQQNRKNNTIPSQTRIDPADVIVPPYLPDLPEVRSDIAIYHDNLTALDTRIGKLLDDLEKSGLADDTIVFYYSDHGGPTPRGKRYLQDTGVKVPLLVRVPTKYQSMTPFRNGSRTDEIVSFVDLAPTLLSLCGVSVPDHMQGRPFLGAQRETPPAEDVAFLFGDRFDGKEGMRRGIRDKRYKYIRRFTPHLPAAPYSQYSLGVPSWKAWQNEWRRGRMPRQFASLWETPQPVEMLFDTQSDPWEIKNLANDPDHRQQLESMRLRLKQKMVASRDSGVIPESLFRDLVNGSTVYDYMSLNKDQQPQWVDDAWFATEDPSQNKMPQLLKGLRSDDPVKRFWALRGYTRMKEAAAANAQAIREAAQDELPAIRVAAAEALMAGADTRQGWVCLGQEFQPPYNKSPGCQVQLVNLAQRVGFDDEIPKAWLQQVADSPKAEKHVRDFAKGMLRNRP